MSATTLTIGTRVQVRHDPSRDRNFFTEFHKSRKWFNNGIGKITDVHTGHGLCYTVEFAFKVPQVTFYDHEELSTHVHEPTDDRIFVFGSNLKAIHGAGAAAYARSLGVDMGVAEGPMPMLGQCRTYALPTCSQPGRPLSLAQLSHWVNNFITWARQVEHETGGVQRIFLSEVGCGIAGFTREQVAPLFNGVPSNVDLPDGWAELIRKSRKSYLNALDKELTDILTEVKRSCRGCSGTGDGNYNRQDNASGPGQPSDCFHCGGTGLVSV